MTVLSDYTVISKEAKTYTLTSPFEETFNTGGRNRNTDVFLTLSIRSLGEADDIPVRVNGKVVGNLRNYTNTSARNWYTQTVIFSANDLDGGDGQDNNISITPPTGDVRLDNVIIHFKQNS